MKYRTKILSDGQFIEKLVEFIGLVNEHEITSDSKTMNTVIGFSTGALERGNYKKALSWIEENAPKAVELSALRLEELEPLVRDLGNLPLDKFHYVSFHAPSFFEREEERNVIDLLTPVFDKGFSIVVHPDVIYTPKLWKKFGDKLLIENMDRRKPIGRTVDELKKFFKDLPKARLCLDVTHARQLDTTLTELKHMISTFKNKVAEIHISELDSSCKHRAMSLSAVEDYSAVLKPFQDQKVATIIESMMDKFGNKDRKRELGFAQRAWSSGSHISSNSSKPYVHA